MEDGDVCTVRILYVVAIATVHEQGDKINKGKTSET